MKNRLNDRLKVERITSWFCPVCRKLYATRYDADKCLRECKRIAAGVYAERENMEVTDDEPNYV